MQAHADSLLLFYFISGAASGRLLTSTPHRSFRQSSAVLRHSVRSKQSSTSRTVRAATQSSYGLCTLHLFRLQSRSQTARSFPVKYRAHRAAQSDFALSSCWHSSSNDLHAFRAARPRPASLRDVERRESEITKAHHCAQSPQQGKSAQRRCRILA